MPRGRRAERRRGRGLARLCLMLCLVVGASACGDGDPAGNDGQEVTLFTAGGVGGSGGLRASLDAFEETTGIRVRLTGSANFAEDVAARVSEGDPPDVALFPQPAFMAELAREGELVPLSGDAAAAVEANYEPDARDLGEVDGELYGVFFAANVKSIVWYRPAVFADRGYRVPRTWEELEALTERIAADGVTPWCFGSRALGGESGWPATDWIETFVLQRFGGEVYDDWVTGTISFRDARIEEAFELFDRTLLVPGQTFGGRQGIVSTVWSDSGAPLFRDPPGCLLNRIPSFWRGSLPEGTTIGPDGDVDVFLLPAIGEDVDEGVLVGGDLAAAFSDRPEVMELLAYLATPPAGEPWAREGGYVSPHRGFDLDAYADPFDRRVAELLAEAGALRFDGSDLMPVAVGEGSFREGMTHFIRTRDFPSTVEIIERGFEPAN